MLLHMQMTGELFGWWKILAHWHHASQHTRGMHYPPTHAPPAVPALRTPLVSHFKHMIIILKLMKIALIRGIYGDDHISIFLSEVTLD